MLEILYYPEGNNGPVREYLEDLTKSRAKAAARLRFDLEILGAEGLRSQKISVRSVGQKVWELKRLYDGIQYRIFFGIREKTIWLLHSIEKKSAKTPKGDLWLAIKRWREVEGL